MMKTSLAQTSAPPQRQRQNDEAVAALTSALAVTVLLLPNATRLGNSDAAAQV
jgi:hypothetical protein